ncbi:hypothetical protein [Armatimonas sp.]|uniref:hypothetical protein n=1 Tax=Armatimonas sp. TaxID=1872638 RepID=UPI0037533735
MKNNTLYEIFDTICKKFNLCIICEVSYTDIKLDFNIQKKINISKSLTTFIEIIEENYNLRFARLSNNILYAIKTYKSDYPDISFGEILSFCDKSENVLRQFLPTKRAGQYALDFIKIMSHTPKGTIQVKQLPVNAQDSLWKIACIWSLPFLRDFHQIKDRMTEYEKNNGYYSYESAYETNSICCNIPSIRTKIFINPLVYTQISGGSESQHTSDSDNSIKNKPNIFLPSNNLFQTTQYICFSDFLKKNSSSNVFSLSKYLIDKNFIVIGEQYSNPEAIINAIIRTCNFAKKSTISSIHIDLKQNSNSTDPDTLKTDLLNLLPISSLRIIQSYREKNIGTKKDDLDIDKLLRLMYRNICTDFIFLIDNKIKSSPSKRITFDQAGQNARHLFATLSFISWLPDFIRDINKINIPSYIKNFPEATVSYEIVEQNRNYILTLSITGNPLLPDRDNFVGGKMGVPKNFP